MEELQQMVMDCMNRGRDRRLTEAQITFVRAVAMQLHEGRPLDKKQAEHLDEVWLIATEKG
jgi:hypothetical protein